MTIRYGITIDKNPLQGFIQLTKQRNRLVHFKGMKKNLQLLEIPNYLDDLKLTPKDCLNNLESVTNLIRSFSLAWIGSYGPDGLKADKGNYRKLCFYLGNRNAAGYLYSDKYDKDRLA